MFDEAELLPLSGLQHLTFCERRWALVQIEMIWEENRFTAEGELLHLRAHSGEIESRPGVLVRRTLPVRSLRLGLSGQADVVEFHPAVGGRAGISIDGRRGLWCPHPVEYKRSRGRGGFSAYHVQLCAQAMCLEEMLAVSVPEGAVYDGTARRRQAVEFTPALRNQVEKAAARMHQLIQYGVSPAPIFTKACAHCSLVERCQPRMLAKSPSVKAYLASALEEI